MERDLEIGQLKYFPNLKMHLQNSTAFVDRLTSHQEIYEEFSNFVAAANVNVAKYFYIFLKWRQTYVFLLFQIKRNLSNLIFPTYTTCNYI